MRRRAGLAAGLAVAALLTAAAPGLARQARSAPPSVPWSGLDSVAAPTNPAIASLLSLAVPGAGQALLGRRRAWAFAAVEVLAWTLHLERKGAGADYRDRYRDFAWNQARAQSAPRVDGAFEYYETMSHWARSGAFDRDPVAGGVQPELDASTFNGAIWGLAAGLYLSGGPATPPTDPGYGAALAYYSGRAYGEAFLWDWGAAGAGRAELGRLIGESDRRFRQATNVLGAILLNHLVASIDAYVTARGLAPPLELEVLPRRDAGVGVSLRARLPLGVSR